jgi:hypothetical protein
MEVLINPSDLEPVNLDMRTLPTHDNMIGYGTNMYARFCNSLGL